MNLNYFNNLNEMEAKDCLRSYISQSLILSEICKCEISSNDLIDSYTSNRTCELLMEINSKIMSITDENDLTLLEENIDSRYFENHALSTLQRASIIIVSKYLGEIFLLNTRTKNWCIGQLEQAFQNMPSVGGFKNCTELPALQVVETCLGIFNETKDATRFQRAINSWKELS